MNYEELINTLSGFGKDPSRLIFEDELTEINNRRFLLSYFDHKVDWEDLEASPLSLLMIDLDNFKNINDSYGHDSGDQALIFVSRLLRDVSGDTAIPIRYAGDEFMILVPGGDNQTAVRIGESLLNCMHSESLSLPDGRSLDITLSLGVASAPDDALTGKELIEKADTALYHAKNQGRDVLANAREIGLEEVFGKTALNQLKAVEIVGRAAQLDAVTRTFERFRTSESQFLVVEGGSGMGKSTLLDTIRRHLNQNDLMVVKVNGVPQEGFRPYYLAGRILAGLLQRLADSGAEVLNILTPEQVSYVSSGVLPLQSLDTDSMESDESTRREMIFNSLVGLIPTLAESRPLIIFIDDLQFADTATLALLKVLMQREDLRVFVCATSSESSASSPDEPLSRFYTTSQRDLDIHRIELTPLTSGDIAVHLRVLFPQVRIPAGVEQTLAQVTQGNPLFLGEILRKLVLDQKIILSGQEWVIQPLGDDYLPQSLEEVIHQKIANLDAGNRQLLAQASTFGEDVSLSFLTGSSEEKEARVLEFVDRASKVGLISSEFDLNDETIRFLGKQVLDVTYDGIQKERREAFHERVGAYQESLFEKQLLPSASSLAYHYGRSANTEKAESYRRLQAVYTARVFNADEAASYGDDQDWPNIPLDAEDAANVPEVLRSMQTAIRNIKYYPPANKAIRAGIEQFRLALEKILTRNERLNLTRHEKTLLVNGEELDVSESLASNLVAMLQRAELRGMAFLKGVDVGELTALLETIAQTKLETIGQRFWEQFSADQQLARVNLKQIRYEERTPAASTSHVARKEQVSGREEITKIQSIIRGLVGACRNIKLYPQNSTITVKSTRHVHETLQSFLRNRGDVTLTGAGHSLLVNGERIDVTEFKALADSFLEFLKSIGVNSLTFLESISLSELNTFVGAFRGSSAPEMSCESWRHFAEERDLKSILFDEFEYEIRAAASLREVYCLPEKLIEPIAPIAPRESQVAEGESDQDAPQRTVESFEDFVSALPTRVNDLLREGRTIDIGPLLRELVDGYSTRDDEARRAVVEVCQFLIKTVPVRYQKDLIDLAVDPLTEVVQKERNPEFLSAIAGVLQRIAIDLVQFSEYHLASKVFASLQRCHRRFERTADDRARAIAGVQKRNLDRATQNLLMEDLKSDDQERQKSAVQLLSSLGGACTLPLVEMIGQERELRVRQLAASLLAEFGPSAAKALKRELLTETLPENRIRIMEVIDSVTQHLEAELVQVLGDQDPQVREAAFRLAERIPNQDTARVLLTYIDHPATPRELRIRAIKCVAGMSVAGIVPSLISCVNAAAHPGVVLAACQALGQLAEPECIECLTRILRTKKFPFGWKWNPETREAAAFALGQIGHPKAVDVLATFTRDSDLPVRTIASLSQADQARKGSKAASPEKQVAEAP